MISLLFALIAIALFMVYKTSGMKTAKHVGYFYAACSIFTAMTEVWFYA